MSARVGAVDDAPTTTAKAAPVSSRCYLRSMSSMR
jgi:hypothetical protein